MPITSKIYSVCSYVMQTKLELCAAGFRTRVQGKGFRLFLSSPISKFASEGGMKGLKLGFHINGLH